jgi:hypothetical protein
MSTSRPNNVGRCRTIDSQKIGHARGYDCNKAYSILTAMNGLISLSVYKLACRPKRFLWLLHLVLISAACLVFFIIIPARLCKVMLYGQLTLSAGEGVFTSGTSSWNPFKVPRPYLAL